MLVTQNETRRDTMKTINVRDLRVTIPHLKEALAWEHELVPVSYGEPIVRRAPALPQVEARHRLPSIKAFRATLPNMTRRSETLIREDRDRRGS